MVFNSLGSNYNFGIAMRSLTAGSGETQSIALVNFLEARYGGKTVLVYKAREAILLAFKMANLPLGSYVAVNGYTCLAVYKAVVEAGLKVEYIDVPEKGLNFSAEQLKSAIAKNSNIKAVVIQNTLGFSADGAGLSAVCKENNVLLLEDLAHSAGAKYEGGSEAGTLGDFTVLSFSQDKTIDAVSGGALIVRSEKYKNFSLPDFSGVSLKQRVLDRWYPLLTWVIRESYGIGLGKAFHKILKNLNLLSSGLGDMSKIILHSLPAWYAGLASFRFLSLSSELAHRKEIAAVYAQALNTEIILSGEVNSLENCAALRFPIYVKNRSGLVSFLTERGIHLSDIWYDAPVGPKKLLHLSDYAGQCPNAEKLSEHMVNLPTHINVTKEQAKHIADNINTWLTLQSKQ